MAFGVDVASATVGRLGCTSFTNGLQLSIYGVDDHPFDAGLRLRSGVQSEATNRNRCNYYACRTWNHGTWNRHYDERYAEQDFHTVVGRIQEASAGDATAPAVVAAPHYFGAAAIYALPEEWIGVTLSANPNLDEQDWDVVLPDFFGNLGEEKSIGSLLRGTLKTISGLLFERNSLRSSVPSLSIE